MKRTIKMTDQYNHPKRPSPAEAKLEEEGEEKRKNGYEIYNEGIRALYDEGYLVEPSQDGKYALHHIRTKEHPGNYEGLKIPSNFWMWRRIDYKNPLHEAELLGRVIQGWEDRHPERAKFFNPLCYPTTGKSKPLFGIADSLIRQQAEEEIGSPTPYKDKISLSGGNGGVSFIPRHEWFREDIRKLTPGDLITILPAPELRVFLNILGRVVVGRNNSVSVEGTKIEHTFRAFCILIGLKGGIGKSTLMAHVNTALKYLGYTVADMPSFDRPFGWNKVIRSNLGYIDDLVPQSQKKFIGNELTKQIVSNGLCTTEQKGIDPIENLAKTVLIANSNSFNPRDLMNLDDGVLSRLNLLQCHDYSNIQKDALVTEASQDSPDYRIKEHWEWLQEKYNLDSPIPLACWLLRLAADEFLLSCGYDYNENKERWEKTEEDFLEQEMKSNRLRFKIGNIQNATEHLMVLNNFFLQCVKEEEEFSKLRYGDIENFNSRLMFALTTFSLNFGLTYAFDSGQHLNIGKTLKKHFYKMEEPEYHPFRAIQIIDAAGSITTAVSKAKSDLRCDQSYPDTLKTLHNNLRTKEGFKLIGEPVWLKRFWDFALTYSYKNQEVIERLKKVHDSSSDDELAAETKSEWQHLKDSILLHLRSYEH